LPSSDPIRRFRDIIDNIDAIVVSIEGLSKEQFFADRDKYDAAERRLSRISEAATKLGLLAEQLAPDQPWANISRYRQLAPSRLSGRCARNDLADHH
jgi:uncharacterized protein with HEPN domain